MRRLEIALVALFALAVIALLGANVVGVSLLANGTILTAAGLKARWVLLDFIGLRARRGVWTGLLNAWVIVITTFCWAAFAVSSYVRG